MAITLRSRITTVQDQTVPVEEDALRGLEGEADLQDRVRCSAHRPGTVRGEGLIHLEAAAAGCRLGPGEVTHPKAVADDLVLWSEMVVQTLVVSLLCGISPDT